MAAVVCGLRPPDRDTAWGPAAHMLVSSGLHGGREEEAVCRGRVLLHLAGTVWLDRAERLVRQPAIQLFVCTFNAAQELQDAGSMPGI